MMKNILFSMLILLSFSCKQDEKKDSSPIKIILDTDMGSNCDEELLMLFGIIINQITSLITDGALDLKRYLIELKCN